MIYYSNEVLLMRLHLDFLPYWLYLSRNDDDNDSDDDNLREEECDYGYSIELVVVLLVMGG